jgi:hypothetical protein
MDEIVPGILHWATFNDTIGQTVHSHIHTPSGAIFDPLLPAGGVPLDASAEGTSPGPGQADHETSIRDERGENARARRGDLHERTEPSVDAGERPDPLQALADPLQALADAVLPTVVLLSSRHHRRDSAAVATEYDIPVKVSKPGRREFAEDGQIDVETFAFGEEVVPGVTAMELGALAPDETVFHIAGTAPDSPGCLLFGDSLIRHDGQLAYVPDTLMGDDPAAVKRGLSEGLQRILNYAEPFDALLFAHGAPLRSGGREALAEFVASRTADLTA